jgi:CobQ-like glutamine amidotransferase family enzyme
MAKARSLRIAHLYPELLNLYGDSGNILVLRKRLEWRRMVCNVDEVHVGQMPSLKRADVVFVGGGSDREQRIVCDSLQSARSELAAFVEDGGVLVAVCGGYQLLGHYYRTAQGEMKGLGLVDLYTEQGEGRLIGNVVLKSDQFDMPIAGFENHGGRTTIGDCRPLGKVLSGYGNDGKSGYEGAVYKNVIGTYLHGPILPKNPNLADYLIRKALERKYGGGIVLDALKDTEELEANNYIVRRFTQI